MLKANLAALSGWSFPLIPIWLEVQHNNISLLFDIFSNLHKSFIFSGLSNFLLFNDVNTDSVTEKIMNFLYFSFKMRSSTISSAHALRWKWRYRFGGVFSYFHITYCGTSCCFLLFISIRKKVRMSGFSILIFSSSSRKIREWVFVSWSLQRVKTTLEILMAQVGILGMIVLCIFVESILASSFVVWIKI